MSGFSIDWLDLRENADQRARDHNLMDRARGWLAAVNAPVVVDLGAGTGATLRAFSRTGPDSLHWRLVDHDETLLTTARERHATRHPVTTHAMDLADISALPIEGARLVTASALFDLASARFILDLAARLRARSRDAPIGLYATLTYDGITRWTPAHPLDDRVLAAFNHDQGRDKGLGPALGPGASLCLQEVFSGISGYSVHTADSPWVLDGADHRLVSDLIEGIAAAVTDSPLQIDASALDDWRRFRQSQTATGTCTVGHTDLLALPLPPRD